MSGKFKLRWRVVGYESVSYETEGEALAAAWAATPAGGTRPEISNIPRHVELPSVPMDKTRDLLGYSRALLGDEAHAEKLITHTTVVTPLYDGEEEFVTSDTSIAVRPAAAMSAKVEVTFAPPTWMSPDQVRLIATNKIASECTPRGLSPYGEVYLDHLFDSRETVQIVAHQNAALGLR